MLIISNQIQDPIFAQQAAQKIAFRYPPPDIWYLDLQKTYQKLKTLISFRMPIISQSLTMAPPFVPLSPKQPTKTHRHPPHLFCTSPARTTRMLALEGSEAICMIYPFPSEVIENIWNLNVTQLKCSPKTRVFSCHLYLTWAPDDPATIHATLPPFVLVLGKPYMWAPQPPPASPSVQQACLIQTSSKTSRWRVLAGIWRIITVSKWLITMVIKSPK